MMDKFCFLALTCLVCLFIFGSLLLFFFFFFFFFFLIYDLYREMWLIVILSNWLLVVAVPILNGLSY